MKLLTTIVLGLSLFAFTSCAHKSGEHHAEGAKKSCSKDKKSCDLKEKKAKCKSGSCSLKDGKKTCCKKKK
jgi:hypothetical protein